MNDPPDITSFLNIACLFIFLILFMFQISAVFLIKAEFKI